MKTITKLGRTSAAGLVTGAGLIARCSTLSVWERRLSRSWPKGQAELLQGSGDSVSVPVWQPGCGSDERADGH